MLSFLVFGSGKLVQEVYFIRITTGSPVFAFS